MTSPTTGNAMPGEVIHVVESLERGGLERMVVDLVLQQRNAGVRSRVVCLYRAGVFADELVDAGIVVSVCDKRSGPDLGALRRLRAQICGSPGAIIHTHNANAHYHAVTAAYGLPLRGILNTRHGMGAANPRSRGEWLYRRSMARTDVVVAVCDAACARFAQQGVRPRKRLVSVPNGIRIERFEPSSDAARARLRTMLAVQDGAKIVGSVARLSPVKDQHTLLHAFAQIKQNMPDAHLVLVGDGPLRAELKSVAQALQVASAVHFLGDRDDVLALLPGFDVFVLSSLSEGYSMALLEACACGLPIVATDVGGNREIVIDGHNGRVVPTGDARAIADATVGLLRDAITRASMGQAGRDWALREASLAVMADRYAALYREIVDAH